MPYQATAEFDTLPYQKLSNKVKRTYDDIMIRGNVPLRQWHDKVKAKLPKRLAPERPRFRAQLLQIAGKQAKAISLHDITIPKTDIQKIMDVKAVEGEILIGYSRMALQITRKWSKNQRDNTITVGDLYNEAIIGLMHAIFYYTRKDVKFSTYCNWIMKRRLRGKCNQTTPLSVLPNHAVDLRQKYEEIRKTINSPTTFQQIVDLMQIYKDGSPRPLTKGEYKILGGSLICVFNQTSFGGLHGNDGHDERISDYTSMGSMEFNGLSGNRDWRVVAMRGKSTLRPVFASREESVIDLVECIKAIDLSSFEKLVLEGFLQDGTSGWKTRIAAGNINPETGNPYTKMGVCFAWKRIIKKLSEQCNEEE
jgi:hypothetical protein